ncbi:AraC family transcriptional regulator [Paenibacillus sp. GD4]|uniref:helix-turn-helix transcriptional regulator n=1 Tax=Paenibacillus sp. GD4 TaxID=3068890 RepID=UPI00279652D8|nr:AraC family transcriptional regulator [Paenibacillus sp. GD4]MDQ1913999.1 AraC family transcriptional regulator [Paenibacillus sp. GD4]
MQTSYGFRYTEDEGNHLHKLFSIGHGCAKDGSYRWNGLKREGKGIIFQYTLKGEGRLRYGKEHYSVPKGLAFTVAIPSDHEYSYDGARSGEGWEFLWIRFELPGEDWLTQELMKQHGPVVEIGAEELPIRLLWALYRDAEAKRLGDRFDLSLRIYEWLIALQRSLLSRASYRTEEIPKAYRRVTSFIDNHYEQDLSLDQLADIAGLNKYHLCKKFSSYLGVSPMDYVRNRRLERAAELLRTTALPITDIAGLSGFSNVSYFGKVFRRIIGMSPSTYREAKEGHVQSHLRLLE